MRTDLRRHGSCVLLLGDGDVVSTKVGVGGRCIGSDQDYEVSTSGGDGVGIGSTCVLA